MPAAPSTGRSNGLDSLRALAITLVFMYHYMVFVSREATFGWASVVGWVGVDLFFVLSGYLIANQLLAGSAQGNAPDLPRFYARRALRTLPVFWLVLAAYFLWPGELGGRTPPPLWRFLTFTQNFELPPGTAFSHAGRCASRSSSTWCCRWCCGPACAWAPAAGLAGCCWRR